MAPNRPLEMDEVRAELERKIGNGGSFQSIWNTGYDFYRIHLRNQDTARVIREAYLAVRGNNEDQQRAITQAAAYWKEIHDYGITNVPAGIDNSMRETVRAKRRGREGNLRMLRPKSGPVTTRESEASMANLAKPKEKRNGDTENPYPGPYYPGVYPP
ncbi:MAG: hypothetical protein LBF41_06405 [Deltaproteobacteria bacterium]|nr:hypothetical protein [Deltaproteobacteria bacterium]